MWNLGSEPGSDRQLPQKHCPKPLRGSVLPLWWKIIHRSRWKVQVLASELSLVAFILLLVMVFSKSWLCLSRSCFYQRWPADISSRIYTSSHIMSMGLLHYCNLKSHSHPENGKGEALHPLLPQGISLPRPPHLHPSLCHFGPHQMASWP